MEEIYKKWLFCGVTPAIEITILLVVFYLLIEDIPCHPLWFRAVIWILGYLGFAWANYWLYGRRALWTK